MIPWLVGAGLAVVLAVGARITRSDRERSFFPTLLIVIAFYYVLFAFMSGEAIVEEILVALGFTAAAVVGGARLPLLVGIGIFLHGVFDFARPAFLHNSGVPVWWPAFCGSVDVLLGAWVIGLSFRRKVANGTAVAG